MKEFELTQTRKRIQEMTDQIQEYENRARLFQEQDKVLKEQLREAERSKKREGNFQLDYLKNIVVKFITTDEKDKLVPVLATLLQLTPTEIQQIKEKSNENMLSKMWWANSPQKKSPSSPNSPIQKKN